MTKVKISIITPCLNSGNSIRDAIESVRIQGYDNYEHIIVDGGSIDLTKEIATKYDNVIWISESDRGQSDALNKGFKLSSGSIIGVLNADDYYLPNTFRTIVSYFNAGVDFVIGNVLVINEDGSKWENNPKTTFNSMLRHWEKDAFCVNPVGYFYRRSVQENFSYNINNHDSMDLEFLLNASLKYSILKINETLGVFNYSSNCKTARYQSSSEYWTLDTWPYIDFLAKTNLNKQEYNQFVVDRKKGYKRRIQVYKNSSINLLFTIIIPTFNVEATIGYAIESIVKQTYDSFELIIVDGASTDNTCAIVKEYQQKHKNIILLSEPDEGIYDAMNKGVAKCKGDYLFFMGADDVLYNENVIQNLIVSGALANNEVVYGNVLIKGNNDWASDKQIYDGKFDLNKLLQKNICQQAIFYPRRVFDEYGLFDLRFPVSSDWIFNLKIFAKERFCYVDQVIAVFATGGVSTSDKTSDSYLQILDEIFDFFQVNFSNPINFNKNSSFHQLILNYLRVRFEHPLEVGHLSKGISVITAIKNRTEHLEQSLPTWLSNKQVDEVVVVDWSSDEPLCPLIDKYQDGRIKLVEVKGQSKWNLAMAYNLAARFSSFDKILKTDADIELLPGFFDEHKLSEDSFYTGSWEKARNENETHLNGSVFIYRANFFKVNGYSEYISTYGWDDTDLYNRLERIGLKRMIFNFDNLRHIEHPARMQHQNHSDVFPNINDEEWARINILANRHLCRKTAPWSLKNEMAPYKLLETLSDKVIVETTQLDKNKIPLHIREEAFQIAIKERLLELIPDFEPEIFVDLNNESMTELYSSFLTGKENQKYNLFRVFKDVNVLLHRFRLENDELNAEKDSLVSEKILNKKTITVLEQKHIDLESALLLSEKTNANLEGELKALTELLINQKAEASNLQKQIGELNLQLALSDRNIEENNKIINQLNESLDKGNQRNYELEKIANEKETELIEKIAETTNLQNQVQQYAVSIERTNQKLAIFEKALAAKQNELDRIINSISYRFLKLMMLPLLLLRPKYVFQVLSKKIIDNKQTRIISRSNFFDKEYYLQHNPDVAKSGMNPARHYLLHGGFEGRNPSEAFDSKFYLEHNRDVKDYGMNPLLHYILYGEKEGRRILPELADVKHESAPSVNTEKVVEALCELKEESKVDLEIRLIRESGLVDKEYYSNYPDIRNAQLDPVEHYYYHGWKEGRNPCQTFDTMFYLETNNDVKETGENPLLHYLLHGRNEKRQTFYPVQIDELKADQYEDKQPIKTTEIDSIIKTIAFYLPQFHPFKENDEWWGEGFTEWTNVNKARPQFEGHYQPRLPGAMGFYDLRLPEIMKKQAELAKEFGIYGFCFHHYYFAGKRLMETPVDNLLAHPEIDLPFCLCWANENWTRRWDGMENDILIAQDHSPKDDINFLNDIEKYFLDPRYIRVDNKPLFIVYKANQFPNMKATIKRWRKHWREKWKEELHIVMAMTFGEQDPLIYGFDAAVEFPPHNIGALDITNTKKTIEGFEGRIFSYVDFMTKSLIPKKVNFDLYKTVFPGWDNTARRDNNASIYADGTANHYKYWLKECIRHAKRNLSPSSQFVFVNAWNEWAEGAHLEPCQKYGYCYLNATARAIEEATGVNGPKVSVIVPNYNHAKYLQTRLDSIYNQTYRNFEVILLDDCSTDNSKEILKNYASEHKEISKLVINTENSGGVFHQWAKGIDHANGDLIWIAESDDFCDVDFLETLVADFNDEAVMLSYSNCVFVDEKGVALDYYSFRDYLKDIDEQKWLNSYNETAHNEVSFALGLKNTIPNVSGVLFRKPVSLKLLKDKKWLSMTVAGDWMFYLHIIQGGRIVFNKHTNNYFRRYKGSTSESTYKKQVFYEEVGNVCATIASLYKVSDDLLKKNRDSFWEFYKSQVDQNHEQFNAWYNFDKVKKAAKNRLPSVMISIYGFYAGGAEIMPIRLANELKRKGITVLLHSCGASGRNEEVRKLLRNDIPVVKSSSVNEIKQVVDSFGIDIVNSHHWQFQQLHSKYADFLGANCKHVGTLHGIIEATDSGYAISNDDLVRVNQHVQSWTYIADKNLVPFINTGINVDDENRFVKIPNGIEIKEYKKIERGELDIPDDAFVLCTISRAIKEKGWFEAIETVKLARIKSKHDIRLILIGDGPVYEKMKTEGVPDFVTLTGYVSEPIGYYAISDMGLLLSTFQSESFPLTILECLSVGKPFIASNIGEIKNILSEGDQMAGQVFELDDWTIPIEEVSSIIIDFAINLSKYQVAQKLCKNLSKRYDLSIITDRYIQQFTNVLDLKIEKESCFENLYSEAFENWQRINDDDWYIKIKQSLSSNRIDGVFAGFTDEATQVNLTGRSGESAIFQAFNFYQKVKQYADKYGKGLNVDTKICDFACGWARITRFFLKETHCSNITGLDCVDRFIKICKESIPIINFKTIPSIPPYNINEKYDVICAFSLFSHLSETVAYDILKELHGMLNKSGIVVFTSRGIEFINYCEKNRKTISNDSSQLQKDLIDCFRPVSDSIVKYHNGIFQFFKYPGNHASDNYGEAAMPKDWIVYKLSHIYELVAFEDENLNEDMDQKLIVLKKNG